MLTPPPRHPGRRDLSQLVETDFGHGRMKDGASWRLQPDDVARIVTDLLDFPERALPSLIEIRPTRPPKK
jgi:hypothetical protein